jgi:putative ABC transport system substrate-binding protein
LRAGFRESAETVARASRGALAITLLLGVTLCGPAARGVGGAEPVKIGALTESWGPTPIIVGLREGLQALGYRDNHQFALGVRFTQGDVGALRAAARDLVEQRVDILFTAGGEALDAAKAATSTIPIVFAGASHDPIGRGFIKSFARPGGNITGVVDLADELAGKRLEVFRDLVPGLRRVLVPYAVNSPYAVLETRAYRDAARQLGIALVEAPVRDQQGAQAVFARLRKNDVHGILLSHSIAWNVPNLAVEAAGRQRIPTMFPASFYVQEGGFAG